MTIITVYPQVLVCLALAAPPARPPTTSPARNLGSQTPIQQEWKELNNFGESIFQAFSWSDWQFLERVYSDLIGNRIRFRDGTWKLELYYGFISRFGRDPRTMEDTPALLNEWLHARPDSVAARVALAEAYIRESVTTRVAGSEQQKQESGRQLLDRAVSYLSEAKSLSKQDPYIYAMDIRVAVAQNDAPRMFDALTKGLGIESEFGPLLTAVSEALLPGRSGSPKHEEEFAERIRRDLGDEAYVLIASAIINHEDVQFPSKYNFSWKRLQDGMRKLEQRWPDSLIVLNRHVRIACVMQDRRAASEYFTRFGDWTKGRVDHHAFRGTVDYEGWRRWALENGPFPPGSAMHIAAQDVSRGEGGSHFRGATGARVR